MINGLGTPQQRFRTETCFFQEIGALWSRSTNSLNNNILFSVGMVSNRSMCFVKMGWGTDSMGVCISFTVGSVSIMILKKAHQSLCCVSDTSPSDDINASTLMTKALSAETPNWKIKGNTNIQLRQKKIFHQMLNMSHIQNFSVQFSEVIRDKTVFKNTCTNATL